MTEFSVLEATETKWLRGKLAPWEGAIFPDLVLSRSANNQAPALIYMDEVISHAELAAQVEAAARTLVGRHGVGLGDHVVLKGENSALFVVAYLAVHRAGGVAVPVNTKLTAPELAFQIKDSQARLILSDDAIEAAVPRSTFAALVQGAPEAALPKVPSDAPATVFYTSGTTGAPKGVIHTHRTLISGAFQNQRGWAYEREGSVTLAMTPLFHIAAHSWFYPVLASGGALVIESYRTERALELITQYRVDGMGAVPAMLLMMLDHPNLGAYDLGSVRNIRFGASSIPPEQVRELRRAFPNAALLHGMGQTESGGTISVLADEYALSKLGSVGAPIPGVAVRLVDDAGEVVPRGTAGEVLARGPHVMVGYLGRPEATAEALAEGWLHTGDIGIMDQDSMIRLVDRKKDMIIRGGENIYSTELEHYFLAHPEVSDCAVIGLPHPLLQEIVGAVIVAPQKPDEALREALIDHGKRGLASFKIPARWFYAEALPRTATGKVQKQKLREALLAGELQEF